MYIFYIINHSIASPVHNVNSRKCVIRMVVYWSMTRIDKSLNPIVDNIAISDTYFMRRNYVCGYQPAKHDVFNMYLTHTGIFELHRN